MRNEKQIRKRFDKVVEEQEAGIRDISRNIDAPRPIVLQWPQRKKNFQQNVLPLFPALEKHLPPLTQPVELEYLNEVQGRFWPYSLYFYSQFRMIPSRLGNLSLRFLLWLKKGIKLFLNFWYYLFYAVFFILALPFRAVWFFFRWLAEKIAGFWG